MKGQEKNDEYNKSSGWKRGAYMMQYSDCWRFIPSAHASRRFIPMLRTKHIMGFAKLSLNLFYIKYLKIAKRSVRSAVFLILLPVYLC